MEQVSTDRNLLLGVLALQMDFIDRNQLASALRAWVSAKLRPLSDVLTDAGALSLDKRGLLEGLVTQHLKHHDNDAARSLQAIGLPQDVVEDLHRLQDKDVEACLRRLSGTDAETPDPGDAFATRVGAGEPTADAASADPYATNASAGAGTAGPGAARAIGTSTSSGLRFRILRPFARGGLGEVLVAEDQELHREVALKQIQDRYADDPDSRGRFVAEAEITGALEHPSIVPVYGLGNYADGRPFYAMRFIRGDSLHDAIERFHKAEGPTRNPGERALALQDLLNRFEDVCQAIAYAHSRGILHRDLKPGNIMLGKYGETLVVDWGLAKPIGQKEKRAEAQKEATGEHAVSPTVTGTATVMGAAVGTPHYMSPEQARGELDRLGPASDVYSLGATLYTLLTGATPVPDRDVGVILNRVKSGDFPKPRTVNPQIHPALEAICLKAMALRPEDRYTSPQLLVDDINHWLADEPVSAWPEPWTVTAGRWLRRHKTFASVAAAGTVGTIVFLIILSVVLNAAKKEEARLKTIAEENFRMAVRAVDRYHTDVSESVLLQEPGLQPLRRELLDAAQEFYGKFVEQRGDDAALRGEFARALFRLGLITGENETETKAIELLTRAADILHHEDMSFAADLARCYRELGRFYRAADQGKDSEAMYKKSLETWAVLTGTGLDVPPVDLARSQNAMGNHYQVVDRKLEKAEAEYREALATWSKLSPKEAETPENLRYQGLIHNNLGVVYRTLGNRTGQAREELDKALAVQARLVRNYPRVSRFQDDLALSYFNLGELHIKMAKYQDALGAYLDAEKICRKTTDENPTVLPYQTRLGEVLARKATALSLDRKHEEAIRASHEALDVQSNIANTDPNVPKYRGDLGRRHVQLANVLARAGDLAKADKAYQDAIRIQRDLAEEHPDAPHFHVDLATSRFGLGMLRFDQKQLREAEEELTKALEIYETLQKRYPEVESYALGVAATCKNLRNLTGSAGNYRIALAPLDRIISLFATANVKQPAIQSVLLQAYWTRADARTALGLYDEALPDWDQALALSSGAERFAVRLYRAIALARHGQAFQASAEAHELAEQAKGSADALFHVARVFALASAAAAKRDGEDDKKLAESCALAAMERLDQIFAVNQKFLRNQREKLTDDADWRALRGRVSFEALMKKLSGDGSMS